MLPIRHGFHRNQKGKSFPSVLCHLTLTLNPSTPHYYYFPSDSTSNEKKPFLAGINDWAASDLSNAKPTTIKRSPSTHLSANSNAGGTLTSASTRSSNNSVLSRQVTITTKVQPTNNGIQIIDGGLSDEDESMGVEREAAVASSVKGKVRATSAVRNILSSMHSC